MLSSFLWGFFIGVFLKELIKQPITLPSKLEDLTKFVLIGREKLISVRAEIRAIDKLDLASDVRIQKRDEAQMLAGALLDAESKIGEIIKITPDFHSKGRGTMKRKELPKEITKNQSSQFQKLANNPEIVEQVKDEAIINEDLPTRTEVLRKIREKENEDYREEVRNRYKEKDLLGLELEKKYRIIYADPPWMYNKGKTLSDKYGDVQKHYPPMEIEAICNLPVEKLSENNCVLFLWATAPKLPEAFQVINSWGFEYKTTAFVWVKENKKSNTPFMGLGRWTRANPEIMILATRGKISRLRADIRQL